MCQENQNTSFIDSEDLYQKGLEHLLVANTNAMNYRNALKFFSQANKIGHSESAFQLGLLYFNNYPYIQKNHSIAFKYFNEAATKGFADAQFYLGECYLFGYGTEKNIKSAHDLYHQSYVQGNFFAADRLCDIHADGLLDGIINIDKALEYISYIRNSGNPNYEIKYLSLLRRKNSK